jgi:type II secretory pathway pseudopilin PulG
MEITSKMNIYQKTLRTEGFSLLEVLISVATISVLCTIAWSALQFVLSDVSSAVKLPNDVAVLNRAVQCYLANGGSLDDVSNPSEVLARLKTRAVNRSEIAGLNGSMIDPRMSVIASRETGGKVAIWDLGRKQFRIVERNSVPGGATPIAEFALKERSLSF